MVLRYSTWRSLALAFILAGTPIISSNAWADFLPKSISKRDSRKEIGAEQQGETLGARSGSQSEKKRWLVLGKSSPLAESFKSNPGLSPSSHAALQEVNSDIQLLSEKVRTISGDRSIKGSTTKASVALFIEASEREVEELKRDGLKIVEDEKVSITLEQTVLRSKAPEVWKLNDKFGNSLKGRGVRIGIVDTGIDYSHPAFGSCTNLNNCPRFGGGYDFAYGDSNPDDRQGHGTHVAGIAAGAGPNYSGIAPEATLFAVKVLNDSGFGFYSGLLAGLDYVLDPNGDNDLSDRLDVINMSIGGYGGSDSVLSLAVDAVVQSGVVAVVAAGNSGPHPYTINSPGSSTEAITVGATFKQSYPGQTLWDDNTPTQDEITPFSSRGPSFEDADLFSLGIKPDLVAPGAIICAPKSTLSSATGSCAPGRIGFSGTSMATPVVAGVAALMLQANPQLSPQELKSTIKRTARRLAPELGGSIFDQGQGLVDAEAAVLSVFDPVVAKITTNGKITGGNYPIRGTAKAPRFDKFDLSYLPENASDWIVAGEGTSQVVDDTLGHLQLPQTFDESFIWLRLRVFSRSESGAQSVTEEFSLVYLDSADIHTPRAYDRTDPLSWFPINAATTIEIKGNADSGDFQRYELRVCPKDGPESQCRIIVQNGSQRVTDGILGSWRPVDTDASIFGFWKIQLKVISDSGSRTEESVVYVDSDLAPGFPMNSGLPCIASQVGDWSTYSCFARNQPTKVDLNGDGVDELGFANGTLISLVNGDGVPLPGWPKEVPTCNRPKNIPDFNRGVTFGDLNNDGILEVIAGDICGRIHLYSLDGTPFQGSPINVENRELSPVAASDIDGDGSVELIFTTNQLFLHVMKPSGEELSGFPLELPAISPQASTFTQLPPAPLVADLDPRPGKEIIVATRTCEGGGNCLNGYYSHRSTLWAVGADSVILPGYPQRFSERIYSPTTFDIDSNGSKDILFIEKDVNNAVTRIHAQHIDGTELPNFPLQIPMQIPTDVDDTVSAADLDGDGIVEIVFVGDNCVHVYDKNGVVKPGFPYCVAAEDLSELDIRDLPLVAGEPLLSNLDSDYRTVEIAIPVVRWGFPVHGMNEILILRHNGEVIPKSPKLIDTAPASTSLLVTKDGSGYLKLMSLSQRMNLYKWDIKACACEEDAWEQSRGGPSKTGEGKGERMCVACSDECPNDPLKLKPGTCGCGIPDIDSDGDLVPDCVDRCPNDGNKLEPGLCGCGVVDSDPDGDGQCGVKGGEPTPSPTPTAVSPKEDILSSLKPSAPALKVKKKKIHVFVSPYIDSNRKVKSVVKIALKLRGKTREIVRVLEEGMRSFTIKRPKRKGRISISYHYATGNVLSKESDLVKRKIKPFSS